MSKLYDQLKNAARERREVIGRRSRARKAKAAPGGDAVQAVLEETDRGMRSGIEGLLARIDADSAPSAAIPPEPPESHALARAEAEAVRSHRTLIEAAMQARAQAATDEALASGSARRQEGERAMRVALQQRAAAETLALQAAQVRAASEIAAEREA
ncbi:MAG TPA: hypothetical protein VFJ62_00555, partial [Usitatibacter sp.]|nr:hypothetical protein [Usitatibacter sp.]